MNCSNNMKILIKSKTESDCQEISLEYFRTKLENIKDTIIKNKLTEFNADDYEYNTAIIILQRGYIIDGIDCKFKLGKYENSIQCICGKYFDKKYGRMSMYMENVNICSVCATREIFRWADKPLRNKK